MKRQTNHEKNIIESGRKVISWEHDEIVDYLLKVFHRDFAELTLEAASDASRRRTIAVPMNVGEINFRGNAMYNKKQRRFTHIEYGDRYNWVVQFSITSRVAFFGRDFYNQIKHIFPFGHSQKKLTAYLTSNYDYLMDSLINKNT